MVEGGGRASGVRGWWVHMPALWLAANVLLATRQLVASWWLVGATGLPRAVAVIVYGGAVAALVTLLWGLLVLRLAWTRSPRFPKAFIVWQSALLVWIAAVQAFVLLTPEFSFSPSSLATAAIEVAVGIFCILVASRADGQPSVQPPVPLTVAAPASTLATVLAGLLGAGGRRGAGLRRRAARRRPGRGGHGHELLRGRLRFLRLFHRLGRPCRRRARRPHARGLARPPGKPRRAGRMTHCRLGRGIARQAAGLNFPCLRCFGVAPALSLQETAVKGKP
ncbi:MAG: hypothetical protein ABTQ30_02810 [Rhizobiaceae bacterium]